ncbi:hypothetical protein HYALB_00012528 [Hymenoscyphus albidus]|uniref:Quercetin 2,3-dioxygenase n=1 Tax=Hymenoscyphus albidus TaxID=595503 RepID=A0A9N9LJT0_9HELO|nr:hypothetical protein HYALB_00012528 [Hymenoscyphus albidus]
MYTLQSVVGATVLAFAQACTATIWVDTVPDHVRPYAINHYDAGGCVIGKQYYRFPVTGPSSDNAFTLIATNAPESTDLGVLPHRHEVHYENFFNYKGRFQLWTNKDGVEETRVLTPGDYGAVPINTTHTFQILDPDTEMVGVISPGGFETLFYALASENFNSKSAPYDPTAADGSPPPANVTSSLQRFDVFAELAYAPRRDDVNGFAPVNSTWRTGPNALAEDATKPYFVAKDFGPKILNSKAAYQVVQPFVTPAQSDGAFTLSTITIAKETKNSTSVAQSFDGHAAFEVLEGQLIVELEGETVSLLQGDVVFIPAYIPYKYYTRVSFTKTLYISQGAEGLDSALIAAGESWSSPIFPLS